MKKKGFIAGIVEQYKKGKKVVSDYQKGANERDLKAAKSMQDKAKVLKAKAKATKALKAAKREYSEARGGSSMQGLVFGGQSEARPAQPMFKGQIGGRTGLTSSDYSFSSDKKKKKRY